MNYYEVISELEHIYLEDSYVLSIVFEGQSLQFVLESVLRETHPQYTPPLPSEQYCYRNSKLVFRGVRNVNWKTIVFRANQDAAGAIDFGNIDTFTMVGERYSLSGDWGEVELECDEVSFRIVV